MRSKRVLGTVLTVALTAALAAATTTTHAAAAPQALTLTWADDFDGPAGNAPDSSKWTNNVGGDGWGNKELQYYTPGNHNTALDGEGNLVITARAENPEGSSCWYGPCKFSSGRLTTQGKFDQAYGRFEARMKLPTGKGMWPAFWTMGNDFKGVNDGWPQCGEIDVMEYIGDEPNTVYGTLHGPGYFDKDGVGGQTNSGSPLSADFHTYAVDWSPNSVTWSLDGVDYVTKTPSDLPPGKEWVFNHNFFMLLNFAVGGTMSGNPDNDSQLPQQMIVDYVHVYS